MQIGGKLLLSFQAGLKNYSTLTDKAFSSTYCRPFKLLRYCLQPGMLAWYMTLLLLSRLSPQLVRLLLKSRIAVHTTPNFASHFMQFPRGKPTAPKKGTSALVMYLWVICVHGLQIGCMTIQSTQEHGSGSLQNGRQDWRSYRILAQNPPVPS